jgi:hypothetical protein
MVIEFDSNGRPDVADVDQTLADLEREPGASVVQGLGARAVVTHTSREVRLVAGRANLTIEVRYSASELNDGQGETPLSNEELDAVARQIAQEVLGRAGQPQ